MTKPSTSDQLPGRPVTRLDVGFHTMKSVYPKRSVEHRPQSLGHQALTSMAGVHVEAEVRRLEDAAYYLAQVHHTDELPRLATPEEVDDRSGFRKALQVRPPCPDVRRKVHPWAVEGRTAASQLDEIGQV